MSNTLLPEGPVKTSLSNPVSNHLKAHNGALHAGANQNFFPLLDHFCSNKMSLFKPATLSYIHFPHLFELPLSIPATSASSRWPLSVYFCCPPLLPYWQFVPNGLSFNGNVCNILCRESKAQKAWLIACLTTVICFLFSTNLFHLLFFIWLQSIFTRGF